MLPVCGLSQLDADSISYRDWLAANLEMPNIVFRNNPDFFNGTFIQNKTADVVGDFKNLNIVIFPQPSDRLEEYFHLIDSLPFVQKQNLVRLFSIYESEIGQILFEEGLPAELKFLAPALSGMNPEANLFSYRAGVWQLSHFQAVCNGAQINKWVDERYNVEKSTRFAAAQIKSYVQVFGNIDYAVAALVFGPAKVRNALVKAGKDTSFNKFVSCLPQSFAEIIAGYQAMTVFLTRNHWEINNSLAAQPDTVRIIEQMHFQQITRITGIPTDQLRFLNPQYKFSIVPAGEKPVKLLLPSGLHDDFVVLQDSIYYASDSALFQVLTQKIKYPPAPNRAYLGEPVKDLQIEGQTKLTYKLKPGDVLGVIAERYDVKVSDLKYWNNIYNERKIRAGQNIFIFVPDEQAEYFSSLEKKTEIKPAIAAQINVPVNTVVSESDKIEYVVKNGESPYIIAKKYKGVTPELILEWNNIHDARKIQVGQKLTIYLLK